MLFALPVLAPADIYYTLTPEPANKSIRVSMRMDAPAGRVTYRIPAWCPGFYFLQNYQHKISAVQVLDANNRTLNLVSDTDTRAWSVDNPAKGAITISYRVAGDDGGLGFFGVSVYPHTTFVNGPAAFMYADGRKQERTVLTIKNPQGWEIATSMDAASNGNFVSGDYDELLDHPIRLGKFETRTFTVANIPFEVVFTSKDESFTADLDAETKRIKALTVPIMKFWGNKAPFKRYVYHFNLAIGTFSGGLEHRASNVIAIPNSFEFGVDDLISHEFFHVWNVKHIRPKVLGPFDYTGPVRTDNLWFAEGVTDYYAKVLTYASGLHGPDYLYSSLAQEIDMLQSSNSRLDHSLAASSYKAWEGSSVGIGDLSFYNKGLVVGLLLDAAIRTETGGKKSLDDVMHYLYERHQLPKPGFEEDGILKAINAVTGQDFTELYKRMVNSPEELPYGLLSGIGMRVIMPGQNFLHFGFNVQNGVITAPRLKVEEQGLRAGDRVVAVDGKPFRPGLTGFRPEGYTISVLRNGHELKFNMAAVAIEADRVIFEPDPWATPEAAALGQQWMDAWKS